jgi:hypothetical protein
MSITRVLKLLLVRYVDFTQQSTLIPEELENLCNSTLAEFGLNTKSLRQREDIYGYVIRDRLTHCIYLIKEE